MKKLMAVMQVMYIPNNLILSGIFIYTDMNIFSFEYGDLSGDGHDERDIVWLKTDLTKEEFE